MSDTTSLSIGQQEGHLEVLLGIARDLTASLAARDRYARLLKAVRQLSLIHISEPTRPY